MLCRAGQSRPLYDALVAIRESPAQWAKLDQAQQRIVDSSIRDMRLSGVGLDGADRERFKVRANDLSHPLLGDIGGRCC
jgi:oligopeptidase A